MTEKKNDKLTRNNGKFVKGNKEGHRFSNGKRTPEEIEAIKVGIANAKARREFEEAIRMKIYGEFMKRDINKFSNKDLNQALRTVWSADNKSNDDEADTTPTINFIEGVDKDKI